MNVLLEPLKYYEQTAKHAHEQNLKEYFNSLVKSSAINVAENRKTAALFRKKDKIAENTKNKINKLKGWRVFLIILSALGVVALILGQVLGEGTAMLITALSSVAVIAICLLVIFLSLNKKIKNFENLYAVQREKADNVRREAERQMQPLNAAFTEKTTLSLIEKVMPGLKFQDDFSFELFDDFNRNYAFINDIDKNRSVFNTVSGRYNENPFVFYRYINHYMGTKTYFGTKVISWRATVRGSDGKRRTVTKTQTLHASVIKPYPSYTCATALNYGNQTAPDLNFSRKGNHAEDWSESKLERKIKSGAKKIDDMAEQAVIDGKDFTEMANSEFDVLFNALDRTHEVQFRVMFSPLAQVNMVKLMRSNTGYGDDFSFIKRGKHNYIISEHAQKWNMDTSPANYYSYDVDIAEKNFISFNNEYFKSVYFDLAPLLSIPAYHEKPSLTFEPINYNNRNYSDYEYEVMANAIGARFFAHPKSRTEVILKAKHVSSTNGTDVVEIGAYSFTEANRVDFIPVFGGDGRMHNVPVPWIEYIPVYNSTLIVVKRMGMDSQQFENKTKGLSDLFDTPSAFYHGLFAKILGNNDASIFESALEKIK